MAVGVTVRHDPSDVLLLEVDIPAQDFFLKMVSAKIHDLPLVYRPDSKLCGATV